jgi:hypothetical protein
MNSITVAELRRQRSKSEPLNQDALADSAKSECDHSDLTPLTCGMTGSTPVPQRVLAMTVRTVTQTETPLHTPTRRFKTRRELLVVSAAALVHCSTAAWPSTANAQRGTEKDMDKGRAKSKTTVPPPAPVIGRDPAKLPVQVAEMRSMILAAVERGDIAELRTAIEVNEMKPDFGAVHGTDPIAHLKSLSGDGEGREVLAILSRMLDSPWAAIPGGRDIENNRLYVWPHFAEVPLTPLSPADEVQLYRLITPAELKQMRETKRWSWWRLAIGADGVWHSFVRAQ